MPLDPASGLPVALALRLGISVVTLMIADRDRVARRVAFVGSAIASVITGRTAVHVLRGGGTAQGVLLAHHASGLTLGYSIDELSAWFLLVLAAVAAPIAVFSLGYVGHGHLRERSAYIGVAFNLLLGAVELVFAAGDAIAFLFAWELMTLTNDALVTTENEERASRRAAYLY